MLKTHAVGIDLGTTYSCISYLNEHGEPVTLANQEGELSTPSVVLFDDSGEIIVGTEALRNSVIKPNRVIQNSKRFMGDAGKRWQIDDHSLTPLDISKVILQKLLHSAEQQIGKIEQAVITVPAQFSEIQRQWVVEAGKRAGLNRVDIINEPVAAALCYVLGSEGLWFTELADEQRIMVYDLGGGTFDLSLVSYQKNEVKVIATSGDLNLGGIDWNRTMLDAIAKQFVREFSADPRKNAESLQFLAIEVENAKRSLTVRPKTALTCQHNGDRKSYQVEQTQFERLTRKLVERTGTITQAMLKDNNMGWAHVDVILTVGGASRMPMIRNALKKLGGRTLNTSLSPDQSIAHGATYYAGMLLTNSDFARSILSEEVSQRLASIKQQSVNARELGILVRDEQENRIPHYLIKANTPLPTSVSQSFGTVSKNQKRVHLRIVEGGTAADRQYVELGTCIIEDLPEHLPENSQIEVTIKYDEQARVHVSAKDVTSGKEASTEIVREESVIVKEAKSSSDATEWQSAEIDQAANQSKPGPADTAVPQSNLTREVELLEILPDLPEADAGEELEEAGMPVPLCNECGEPLDHRGACAKCPPKPGKKPRRPKTSSGAAASKSGADPAQTAKDGARDGVKKPRKVGPRKAGASASTPAIPIDDDEILELEFAGSSTKQQKPKPKPKAKQTRPIKPKKAEAKGPSVKAPPLPPSLNAKSRKSSDSGTITQSDSNDGEEEFWQLSD